MSKRNVVICGSMTFYHQMRRLQTVLAKNDITALIPEDDESSYEKLLNIKCKSSIDLYKGMASRIHIKKIWRVTTRAILVVNSCKRNIDNYIGANSLAEIALAFAINKKIFLLYGSPTIYSDELSAWGAIPLMGDLSKLVSYIKSTQQEQFYLPGMHCYEK